MAKLKWITKKEIESNKLEKQQAKAEREKHKGKGKDKLTRKDLDELIIIIAEEKGLL